VNTNGSSAQHHLGTARSHHCGTLQIGLSIGIASQRCRRCPPFIRRDVLLGIVAIAPKKTKAMKEMSAHSVVWEQLNRLPLS